jgi:hypothetical protein
VCVCRSQQEHGVWLNVCCCVAFSVRSAAAGSPAAAPVSTGKKNVRVFENGFEIHNSKMGDPHGKLAKGGKTVKVRCGGVGSGGRGDSCLLQDGLLGSVGVGLSQGPGCLCFRASPLYSVSICGL